jgi:phosphatidylglycerol:prolipoprotein diacylglycerol transferase
MYPNLYYAFHDLFGVEWNWLRIFNSFGFFVALAFIAAAWVLTIELKRKQGLGAFIHTEEKITVGSPVSLSELLVNFFLGFLLGYKIIGAITIPDALNDPQNFILSTKGNWGFGLLIGLFFAGLKWWEKNKHKLKNPEERIIRIWPHDRVGDMVIYAALFGFAGAKVFDNLEHWDSFVKDPIGSLISFSGLTFYGGLICAAVALYFYAKKFKIPFIHLCDAAAPGLMLAYAIGRIGCQIAGDGDWGILNSALISNAQGHLIASKIESFYSTLNANKAFYSEQFSTFSTIPSLHIEPFWGLPSWLFGYNYPHNVVNEGVAFVGCNGNYCNYLPISVFPTPFYETIMALVLFAILWGFRNKVKIAGRIFAIYLVMNGLERFIIEKIRVNSKYTVWGFHPTQAEIISSLLIIVGILLFWYAPKIKVSKV